MRRPRRWLVWRALAVTPSIRRVPADDAVPTLIAAASRRTGRTIELTAAPLPSGISAVWSSDARHDLIEYSTRVPPATAFLGIAHELGHILCRHDTDPNVGAAGFWHMTSAISPDLANRLLRMRSGTSQMGREEAEAEMYARVVYKRALRAYALQIASPGNRAFNLAASEWND